MVNLLRLNTPVLLIAWRRPAQTRLVIDSLRSARPRLIYVACDGASVHRAGEVEKVAQTRALIEREINWECQVKYKYSDHNQGCRLGVETAISWFFKEVDEGIILEDDCVPHAEFFQYCAELLDRYRHDERIWCISGCNFQDGQWRGDGSYYFSRYNHCWGWASWRRCWKHYDSKLNLWPKIQKSGLLGTLFERPEEVRYWTKIWDHLHRFGEPDTWDYQWTFTCLINGGLTALPNRNLVQNIGFGIDATHRDALGNRSLLAESLGEIKHPSFILRDCIADKYTFPEHYRLRLLQRIKAMLRRKLLLNMVGEQ